MATRSTGVLIGMPANTVTGKGMLIPFVKATWHLLTVHHGIAGKMLMTNKEAATEIEEAVMHLKAMNMPTDLMTDESAKVLSEWKKEVEKRHEVVKAQSTGSAADKPVKNTTEVKDLITKSFEIFARMDLELAGIESEHVDPGTAR